MIALLLSYLVLGVTVSIATALGIFCAAIIGAAWFEITGFENKGSLKGCFIAGTCVVIAFTLTGFLFEVIFL